jgi:hypothetical protein
LLVFASIPPIDVPKPCADSPVREIGARDPAGADDEVAAGIFAAVDRVAAAGAEEDARVVHRARAASAAQSSLAGRLENRRTSNRPRRRICAAAASAISPGRGRGSRTRRRGGVEVAASSAS